MSDKYKIVLNYIKDLSVEIPNPEALITSRNNIGRYEIKVNISSKPLKLKMIEVTTKAVFFRCSISFRNKTISRWIPNAFLTQINSSGSPTTKSPLLESKKTCSLAKSNACASLIS